MRENTLAMFLPAACVQPEAQPEVCPDDDGVLALITQTRSGDMAAFDRLMRRYERSVLMTALRFLNGNVADAQDAAQTVFLRLHRSLGQFHSDASFPAWRSTGDVAAASPAGTTPRERERVETAEAILHQPDTPTPPRPPAPAQKDVQITAYLIIASPSGTQSTPLPKDLAPAVSQVASILPCKSFRLFDAVMMRASHNSNGDVRGVLPMSQQTFAAGGSSGSSSGGWN